MAYGSTPSDANWNPLCDLYLDEVIDFEDLMIFAMHYGESSLVHNITKDEYYLTIQAALDGADSGDTIKVSDGAYYESITFPSAKMIILQSVNGPSSTIIRGNNGSPTINFNGSLAGTTIDGFTITYEIGNIGNGIEINNSDQIINNCTISDNFMNSDFCFGILLNGGNLTITESYISNNSDNEVCIGVFNNSGTFTITGSTISNNISTLIGGGIYFDFPTSGILPIGGDGESEKNIICGNGQIDGSFSLDFQIADAFGSLYDTYKDINYISAYCE